jgi:inward rectifier potassium channel
MWDDFYHRALTMTWPVFFGLAISVFLMFNALFAMIYQIDPTVSPTSIPKAWPARSSSAWKHSPRWVTATCIRSPSTRMVATAEIIIGMGNIAVVTGLIFARFSRPRAKIIFGKHPVVRMIDGKQTLMLRAANVRLNLIAQASAQLHLVRMHSTPEGFPAAAHRRHEADPRSPSHLHAELERDACDR